MKKAAEQFPLLRDFARGYLHQDLLVEYGDVLKAAESYLSDLDSTEKKALASESRQFMTDIHDTKTAELNQRLHRMGSAWSFVSADEFLRVLHLFDRGH